METVDSQSSLDGSQDAPPLPDHPFLAEKPEQRRKTEEQPLPTFVSQTGVVYTGGSGRGDGQLLVEERILGKKILGVTSTMSSVYVLCDEMTDAVLDITFGADKNNDSSSGNCANDDSSKDDGSTCKIPYRYVSISGGKSNVVGLTFPDPEKGGKQELYSWGSNATYGELGLGALTNCSNPILIPTNFNVRSVASGSSHSAVIDSYGNIFTWGQNFSNQLGLYLKPDKLPTTESYGPCAIEKVIMTPRIVPFSLKNSIAQVACGGSYTVAVSMKGDIWAWGGGECGQLGGGRCTSVEVPKITVPAMSENDPFVAVTCGFAHTMAVSKNGALYVWGFNHNGQLGLGDNKSRYNCTKNEIILNASKVYAHGNSSACIDKDGCLYTWGAGTHYRTMHENIDNLNTPKKVQKFVGDVVHSFAFSETQSTCFVPTVMKEISPTVGPQKSMAMLEVIGSGLWDSKDILVKFTVHDHPQIPARSSIGKYVNGRVRCKPPRLPMHGDYSISLTMNGKDFVTNESVVLSTFADPSILEISPHMIDLNTLNNEEFELSLTGTHFDSMPAVEHMMCVKLTNLQEDPSNAEELSLVIPCKLVSLPELNLDPNVESTGEGSDVITPPPSAPASVDPMHREHHPNRTVKAVANLTSILPSDGGPGFFSVQISLNGSDWSIPCDEHIFAHAFTPEMVIPEAVCLDSEQPAINVGGSGMFETRVAAYVANFSISSLAEPNKAIKETTLDIDWKSFESLQLRVPDLSALVESEDDSPEAVALRSEPAFIGVVNFMLKSEDSIELGKSKSATPLSCIVYRNLPVQSSTKVVRRAGGTKLKLSSGGFTFPSSSSKVAFSYPGLLEDIVLDAAIIQEGESYVMEVETPDFAALLEAQNNPVSNERGVDDDEVADVDGEGNDEKQEDDDIDIRPLADMDNAPAEAENDENLNENTAGEGGEEYGVELLGVDPNVLKLSVLIDGVTYPPEEMSLSLVLFDQVVLTQPHPPKGGFLCAESTDVTIEASGLPPCESAIIRIRGESGEPIDISGTVSEDLSSITIFLIDGGLGDLQGEIRNKKETWYFLDVSVDGTNFDESETAILQIKH